MLVQFQIRQRTVPLKDRKGNVIRVNSYREAQRRAERFGGLPLHELLDSYLCDNDYRNRLPEKDRTEIDGAFPLVARQLIAYPAENESFRRGEDITSASGFMLLWRDAVKLIPPSEIIRPKTGLLIDPKPARYGTRNGQRVTVVQPRAIAIIHPFIQIDLGEGMIGIHGIPLETLPGKLNSSAPEQKRFLRREQTQYFGSLARIVGFGRRLVGAGVGWSDVSGVARVAHDVLSVNGKELVRDVSLEVIQQILRGETPEVLKQALSRHQLGAAVGLACTAA